MAQKSPKTKRKDKKKEKKEKKEDTIKKSNVLALPSRYTKDKEDDLVLSPAIGGKHLHKLLAAFLRQPTPYKSEQLVWKMLPKKGRQIDQFGNIYFFIGKKPTSIFSCHMDTVHRNTDKITLWQNEGYIWGLTKAGKPSVLGADDKIGMYIMCRMMNKRIPGIYIFHIGEEKGGVGSSWITEQDFKWMKHVKRCVAFDRKGYSSVITHQFDRCCSDEFGDALAAALNPTIPAYCQYELDKTGTFTDSANYTNVVPECSNLSVGYFDEHTTDEHFDCVWLEQIFIPAVLNVDWDKLPTVRKAGDSEKHNGLNKCTKAERKKFSNSYTYSGVGNTHGVNGVRKEIFTGSNNIFTGINSATPWDKIPSYKLSDLQPKGINQWVLEAVLKKHLATKGIDLASRELAKVFEAVTTIIMDYEKVADEKIQLEAQVEDMERQIEFYDQYWGDFRN